MGEPDRPKKGLTMTTSKGLGALTQKSVELMELAEGSIELEQFDEAIAIYDKVIAEDPNG